MFDKFTSPLWRTTLLASAITPLLLTTAGCGSDNDKKNSNRTSSEPSSNQIDQNELTGTFTSSTITGLTYSSTHSVNTTDENGTFTCTKDEPITFSIGNLELGSTQSAENINLLSITPSATDVSDQRVTNKLVLLHTLDKDGDLNNGITISDDIRNYISSHADAIQFDQPPEDFRNSLEPLIAELEEMGVFCDTDPRPRSVRKATVATDYFTRSTSERTLVTTSEGDLSGFAANETTWQFLGVPYARPPLGDLRWRPPELPEAWEGVRDAVAWANQSAQDLTLESVNEGGMSEDSLYLNITAPKNASDLPVMVWFHGGSFAILSANSKQYNNPESLTTKDVVLVTVNHRLGPFGYIAHPLLTEESGYNGSGNYGQMDLVMALQWIQKNIGAFGGDASNVTIFGQSGGGAKSYSLMNSPLASGLFHKAIVQSGFSPLDAESSPEETLATSEAIGSALFERTSVNTLEEARALPWTAFVQADMENDIPRQTYRPNADFYYQPKTYHQNMMDGLPSDVPLMSGATSGDYDTLRAALPVWLTQRTEAYQSEQFVYKFSRVPDGWNAMGLKSCHGCELPYLFNNPAGQIQNFVLGLVLTPEGEKPAIADLNGNGISGTDGDAEDVLISMQYGVTDASVSDQTMTIWTNFAKTGNPSTETLNWPAYTLANDTFVEIGPSDQPMVKTGVAEALQ